MVNQPDTVVPPEKPETILPKPSLPSLSIDGLESALASIVDRPQSWGGFDSPVSDHHGEW